ncbi:MAG: hypothetical protein LUD48_06845 [Prevotella sp.]|nr:hypothetical protein [Prevotella sp.]
MKDDFILEQKFGRELSFKVPESYFSEFEKQLLENLPELHEKKVVRKVSISRYWRLIVSVAACVAVLVVSSVVFFNKNVHNDLHNNVSAVSDYVSSSAYEDYVIDEYSDYALLDNDDFYTYVMDE